MTELLPCPFCGGPMAVVSLKHRPQRYYELWSAGCNNLPVCGYGRTWKTREEAIAWINTRVAAAPEKQDAID